MLTYKKEELEKLIFQDKMSYEEIGKIYNVSGNAIKKAAKKLGINLVTRRVINNCETFSRGKSKLNNFSDQEFIKIINNNIGWKNIGKALGYSNIYRNDLIQKILDRCNQLNIKPILKKQAPIFTKTKQELLQQRKNYQSYRSSIRIWAERIYKNSNKPMKCAICGYDKHVEIAHIKPVSDFADSCTIAEINSINNLIALCPNHHWEYDNKILKLS